MNYLSIKRFMSVALLGISAIVISSVAKAQANPICYMIMPSGETVNLASICGQSNQLEENPPTTTQNIQPITILPTPYFFPNTVSEVEPVNLNTLAGQQRLGRQNDLRNQAYSRVYPQLKLMTDSMVLRSDPIGGTLVEQVPEGEWVTIYPAVRSNNSVYVETQGGTRGWITP